MRVVLLGTKGGPRVSATHCGPGQIISTGERVILVDSGQGIPQQLVRAGVNPASLTDIVITHHHSDHNVALGTVLMAAWAHGLDHRITVHGPRPIDDIVDAHLRANAYDIAVRVADEGRPDLRELITSREIDDGDELMLGDVRMRAVRVRHAPVEPALGYRFDAVDGASVVISGDTGPSPELVDLARGADLLIHEVINPDLIHPYATGGSNADWADLRRHLVESHTSIADVGRIAARADVGKLVLSHLVPGQSFDTVDWRTPVERDFAGEVVLGEDLMELFVRHNAPKEMQS